MQNTRLDFHYIRQLIWYVIQYGIHLLYYHLLLANAWSHRYAPSKKTRLCRLFVCIFELKMQTLYLEKETNTCI